MPIICPADTFSEMSCRASGRVHTVSKTDVIESGISPDWGKRGTGTVKGRLGRHVEDIIAQTLDQDPRMVEILPHLRQPQNRLDDPPRQHEGDEFADRELALDHEVRTKIERKCRDDLDDELNGLACPIAERQRRSSIALWPCKTHACIDILGLRA
jgi:hypothetical protein